MGIKKYKDDYEIVFTMDENGRETSEAVYRGKYFEVSLDEDGLLQFRRQAFLLLAVIVVLHFLGGFVDNQGMYQFFVSLPYVIGFLPMFYFGEGVFRLPKEKRKYRREEVERSFDRMKSTSKIIVLTLGIGLLGEIIFLAFFSSRDQSTLELLYLSLEALATAAAYFLIRLQQPVTVQACTDPQRE